MTVHVLIAEDDAFLNETLRDILVEHGMTVTAATNGEEAITAIDAQQPDILLLDILMPKVDGFGVLQHIREKGYAFPVIMLSNLSDEDNERRSRELGAHDYFVKSDLDEDELWPRIEHFLGQIPQTKTSES